jgi:hypothetical protein
MAYYLTLFYPPWRTGKSLGLYFTAAQVSAAGVRLVSGWLPENGRTRRGMFLLYGLVTIIVGISLL